MKKITIAILLLSIAWSCNDSSTEAQAKLDENGMSDSIASFVALDRAYIPTLFLTSIENMEASKVSFDALRMEWASFLATNASLFDDPQWSSDLEKIEQHLYKANEIISGGQHLKEAHEELEHLREILLEARRRNQIDYFVDYLTDFHEPMEKIVLTAKLTPPDQWTAETTEIIKTALPRAQELWQAVQKADFQPEAYQFNPQRHQKMQAFLSKETKAITQLKQSLESQKPVSELRAAALGIKPNFTGLFKLFGGLEAYKVKATAAK